MRHPRLFVVTSSLAFGLCFALSASAQQPAPPAPPAPPPAQPAQPAQPGAQPPVAPAPAAPPPAAAQPLPPLPPAAGPPPAAAAPPAPPPAPPTFALPPPPGADGAEPDFDPLGSAGARGLALAPPGYRSSDFMDTRLTWTFGDDDFLHPTGQLVPLSPSFSIGDRPQYRLFFDSLNSRFSGRENLTHLVMYKKLPGFLPHLTTEAAVVLRFDMSALATNSGNLNQAFYDSGSYIRLFYNTAGNPQEGVSLVFFPLDTDRFRLGYLYDISWGGTAAYINQSIFPRIQGTAPGLKMQYDAKRHCAGQNPDEPGKCGYYAFAGFKTATIVQPQQVLSPGNLNDVETVRVGESNFGWLGGVGIDPLPYLRLDGGAGYFSQGRFDLDDVRGQGVYTYGGSVRAVVHKDMPVPQSVDFLLYKNDPMAPMILFAPEKYDPNELAWSVSAEADVLGQHLKDFDVTGGTRDQVAWATALQGVLRQGYLRLSVTGIARDLNYVVRNVPGFIPFETLPNNTKTDPEIFGAIAADYYLPRFRLTPGIGAGLQLPSTFKSEFTDGGVPASRTIVVRSQGDESILPYDQDRKPIVQARLSVRWDISRIISAIAWLQYVRDPNGTLVVLDPTEGTASLRVPQPADRLGAAVSLQARF